MSLPEGLLIALFAAISLLSAAAAVVLTGYIQRAIGRMRQADLPDLPETEAPDAVPPVSAPIRYAFANGLLLSDLREDDPFLASDIERRYAPKALSDAMATLHPDLPERISELMARGEPFRVIGYMGPDALSVTGLVDQEKLVITVAPALDGEARFAERAEREAATLRRGLALSVDAQWTESGSGKVIWCNETYLKLSGEVRPDTAVQPTWPPPRLFGEQLDPPPIDGSQRRCHVTCKDAKQKRWFEVTALRLSDTEILFNARPVDRLVTAETSLRDFVQTLSKTFATLPVGLVVFDRKRELVLFNPALVSVSRLEPGFLTRRPTLRAFLDQLRDIQRMPEPRDYRSWREEIAQLEEGAVQDRYHEIWSLPSGETLRVTGRPHPNGAIAFLFEDISQEVSLTRRFRTDLDLDRGILDDLPAGLIVFDRDGVVLRTNAAYRTMVAPCTENDTEDTAALEGRDETLAGMTRAWQEIFMPSGVWGDIRQFTRHETARAAWSEAVTHRSGKRVHCRVAPLRGGHTIVWFLPEDSGWVDPLSGGAWFGDAEPLIDGIGPATGHAAAGRGEGAA